MDKRLLFLGSVALGSYSANGQPQNNDERPNILWIVSEDNTADYVGCYGNPHATTPNIDKLASEGILYTNVFSSAPVSAPSRNTLITGMYPTTLGTENMRSTYPIPDFVQFFPKYLRDAGYYTTNNAKKDYNTLDQEDAWDESSNKASYKNRKPGQPFFAVFNINTTHESSIFPRNAMARMRSRYGGTASNTPKGPEYPKLKHNPDSISIPPYLPDIPEMRHDFALYYDRHEQMDAQVGAFLKELDEAGLTDNTIVFYYGDNGGVLGRSKRYIYESGLHVPMVIRIPEKFKHLVRRDLHGKEDRLVNFVDFAPTILSLAGIEPPAYYQGKPFLGKYEADPVDVTFNFRGRMDEGIDLVRSLRTPQYRYVRNYYPHRIYGQHLNFLWMARSIQAWEREYKEGRLNEVQSRFFREKPVEELYDVINDPDNIHNLADDPQYKNVLLSLREKLHERLLSQTDAGFIPEAELVELSKTTTPYDYAHLPNFNFEEVLKTAETASSRDASQVKWLTQQLKNSNPTIRYWAATGLLILGKEASSSVNTLKAALADDKPYVQIAAAEALYGLGERVLAIDTIKKHLRSDNPRLTLQAIGALQNVDEGSIKSVKPELEELANGTEEYTTRSAKYLLGKISQ